MGAALSLTLALTLTLTRALALSLPLALSLALALALALTQVWAQSATARLAALHAAYTALQPWQKKERVKQWCAWSGLGLGLGLELGLGSGVTQKMNTPACDGSVQSWGGARIGGPALHSPSPSRSP